MKEELRKTQKLESLAVFARSVAHQFNNIMTALAGNIILAKMYAKPGSEVSDILIEGRGPPLGREPDQAIAGLLQRRIALIKIISLSSVIAKLTSISSGNSGIGSDISLPMNLWPVEADEAQIRQALVDPVINAR